MNIVMLGIVGAGKGTQAKRLAEYLEIPHISTGDIFRSAAEQGTELGLKARSIMNDGGLVPDDIVIAIVAERLSQDDVKKGYILDGFPRTISQAEDFANTQKVDKVFYISIPEAEVLKRLMGRRMCASCNAQYNTYLDDITDTCTKCGGQIVSREDDTEDTIKIRIENYIKQTKPLIDYYEEKGSLIKIDGQKSISEVFEEIKSSF